MGSGAKGGNQDGVQAENIDSDYLSFMTKMGGKKAGETWAAGPTDLCLPVPTAVTPSWMTAGQGGEADIAYEAAGTVELPPFVDMDQGLW